MLHPILAFMWPGKFSQHQSTQDQSKSSGKSKAFERLQDGPQPIPQPIPLGDIYTANENRRGEALITSPDDHLSNLDASSTPHSRDSSEPLKRPGISVRKEWGIQRSD